MSAFVKIVAFVGFASMASATHDCETTTYGVGGDCSAGTTCGSRFNLAEAFDLSPTMCGEVGSLPHVCCSDTFICQACESGCDPDFECVTLEEFIAGENDTGLELQMLEVEP